MQYATEFFADEVHRNELFNGKPLDQKVIIGRYKDSMHNVVGKLGDMSPRERQRNDDRLLNGVVPIIRRTQRLSSKKILEAIFNRDGILYNGGNFTQRQDASRDSHSVVKFFYEALPVKDNDIRLLLESADFLCRNTSALGNSFTYHLFARHELVAHLIGLVFGADFIFSNEPHKSNFVERLFHPTYVCCIGATLLHHLKVAPNSPDRRLKDLVRDHIFRYWNTKKNLRKIAQYYFGNDDEDTIATMKKEIRECLSGPAGTSFIMDCWNVTSLLHDCGYYLSLLWGTIGHNLCRQDDGYMNCDGPGTFAGFSRSDCFRCFDGGYTYDIPKSFQGLEELCDLFDFIPRSHLMLLKGSMFKTPGNESLQEQKKLYFKKNRQYHPAWGALELLERAAYYKKSKDFQKTFLLLNAAAAIYTHHYFLEGDETDNAPETVSEELSHPIMFKKAPIAYLLKLLDSSQNFSRFRFKSMGKKLPRNLPIGIFLKKDELSVKLNIARRYKTYSQQKAFTITFCGKKNDPSRTQSLRKWVDSNNEDQQKHYNPSKGAFFVNVRNSRT